MSVFYHYNEQHIFIHGQTYPLRGQIKALGGRFLGDRKIWMIPNSAGSLSKIDELCKKAGGGSWSLLKKDHAEPSHDRGQDQSALKGLVEPESSDIQDGDKRAFSVRELMEKAGQLIENGFPGAVWVTGEIQNLQLKSSGGFLDLAENDPESSGQGTYTVRCTLWKTQMKMIESQPGFKEALKDFLQDGLKVRCLCKVNFYQGRGSVSLNILNIDPEYTKGSLALAREKLLKELRLKGLDQANKQRTLSVLPLRIGLISADGSRAYSDFVHQLESGGFKGNVLFIPCPMQGDKTPELVMSALNQLEKEKCDLIVLTRGGGSAADLRWFDDPALAYALCAIAIPVLSAIGHHDDFCVVEEISYLKQKTPTAAADFILERMASVREFLNHSGKQIQLLAERRLFHFYQLFHFLNASLVQSISSELSSGEQRIFKLTDAIEKKALSRIQHLQDSVALQSYRLQSEANVPLQRFGHLNLPNLKQKLDSKLMETFQSFNLKLIDMKSTLKSLDPVPWMNKGWTRLSSDKCKGYIKNIEHLDISDRVKAFYLDGSVDLIVEKKSQNIISKRT